MSPIDLSLLALVLLVTGAVAGVLAGLLGVGGGIVIVPMLFHLFGLLGFEDGVRMPVAVGTSLATIVPTAFMSARAHHRRGSIDGTLVRGWGPWVLAGAVGGSLLAVGRGGGTVMTALFAGVAVLVAAHMAFVPEGRTFTARVPEGPGGRGLAVVIGGLSAMMGIGGGTLSVPILSACSHPIRRAVGTAAALGLIIAIPGSISFALGGSGVPGRPPWTVGYVNLISFVLIVPATLVTTPLGVRLAHVIEPAGLRKAFAFFLFVTSARMLYSLF
ncbi:MAG: Uncharacterized protein FD149_1439 [Rhodospirillaceae bacterium]|nr:MAG: Uncharacterized protein FD149_1439 [Rhodospirillaceae bacterium]